MLRTKLHTVRELMEPNWKLRASRSKKTNAPCKKHPKHRQSPGVCSICLNDKLSQLSNSDHSSSSSSRAARSGLSSSSSSLSSYVSSISSSNASSCASPAVDFRPDARNSIRFFKKSRSMAFVPRRRKEESDYQIGIVKGGFWSKLFPRKSRGLMHSRTTRERIVTSLH